MAVGEALRVTKNFYRKQGLQVITENKKHSLKQVIPIRYTLNKRFAAPATFEDL